MDKDSVRLCLLLVTVVAIGFLTWGFMDTLKKRQDNEKTMNQVISRQIRGFALIVLAQVIVVVGGVICYGLGGNNMGEMGRVGSFLG